jgi:hypothetical protein
MQLTPAARGFCARKPSRASTASHKRCLVLVPASRKGREMKMILFHKVQKKRLNH